MTTALEYAASFGRRKPTQEEVAELYRMRDLEVDALAKNDVITVEDIQSLEWGGKFKVANEHFDKCDDAAKHSLLHDKHHGVRSAAALFIPTPAATPAPTPSAPGAQASVADVALVIMNGKKRLATLHGLKSAAGIEEMISSTHPLQLLERAEAFIAGFEGDDLQEGIAELLTELRAAIKPIR
jgi:hypothetical protein